jgi:hypothetical protein
MGAEDSGGQDRWYVLLGTRRLGPHSFEWLVEAASITLIRETDLVRCPGQTAWTKAGSVPGLFSLASGGADLGSCCGVVAAPCIAGQQSKMGSARGYRCSAQHIGLIYRD